MAQITYRGNLASDDFPLLSAFQGQTVIVGRIDQDFELTLKQGQRLQKEKQIPQIYYCHNVMPTSQGYQSVGFVQKIAAMNYPVINDFNQAFTLRDPVENRFIFVPAGGNNYVFDKNVGVWTSINPFLGANKLVTVAYINGETYIFYQKTGCFRYDQATTSMVAVVLTGLVVANINGICAAQGFLVAWDDANNVYRSQAASPLNFTPDPSLGSGAGIPQDIRGQIVVILPIPGGYLVYTKKNIVAGVFQQNIRYPFIYREVAGSSGILSEKAVSWQDNLGDHYAWTTAGLQKVDKSKAENVYPEITDFLTAGVFEDYDDTTDTFTITEAAAPILADPLVTLIASRFLVISYGIGVGLYSHALIYDLTSKRLGKVKIQHRDCYDYSQPNLVGVGMLTNDLPKDTIGFMSPWGEIKTVEFDLAHTGDMGVLILGKFQFIRERLLTLLDVMLENINQAYNFSLRILTSLNGKTISSKIKDPTLLENVENFRHWGMITQEGTNHSIVCVGTFHLTSIEMLFKVGGHR